MTNPFGTLQTNRFGENSVAWSPQDAWWEELIFVYLYLCICVFVFVYLMSPQEFCLQGCLAGVSRLAPPLVFDIPDKGAPISFEKCPKIE